jgi:selenocysteine lyase/cysteine desulfurase
MGMHPSAVGLFSPVGLTYVDSASYGLPPNSTVQVMQEALTDWQQGTANWIADWDPAGDRCRPLAADLLGSGTDQIALLPAVSVGVGVALSALEDGVEILIPDDEFASMTLPVVVAAERHRHTVRRVPFDRLAESVSADTALVLTSHVRSNDGRVQDLRSVAASAKAVGARVLVDATHSAGVLPIDTNEIGIDVVVAAAYKHLLCPRGVAFMGVSRDLLSTMSPLVASWRSAREPYSYYYGGDLGVLAPDAAKFDVSLAWHAWVGAERSLEFLGSVPVTERASWCVGLADQLAAQLDVPATGSSILTVTVARPDEARQELARRRIVTSGKGPNIRISFHLYNEASEADLVAEALKPFLVR